MSSASWLRWVLAATMTATALYHLVRLVVAQLSTRRRELEVDLTHAAMGVSMALMLVGSLTARAGHGWAIAFVVPAVWFARHTVNAYKSSGLTSAGPALRETLFCTAMVYMLARSAGAEMRTPGLSSNAAEMRMPGMVMPAPGSLNFEIGRLVVVLLAVATAGAAIWTVTTSARVSHRSGGCSPAAGAGTRLAVGRGPEAGLAPRLTAGCQVAMNVTTVYMLALML